MQPAPVLPFLGGTRLYWNICRNGKTEGNYTSSLLHEAIVPALLAVLGRLRKESSS